MKHIMKLCIVTVGAVTWLGCSGTMSYLKSYEGKTILPCSNIMINPDKYTTRCGLNVSYAPSKEFMFNHGRSMKSGYSDSNENNKNMKLQFNPVMASAFIVREVKSFLLFADGGLTLSGPYEKFNTTIGIGYCKNKNGFAGNVCIYGGIASIRNYCKIIQKHTSTDISLTTFIKMPVPKVSSSTSSSDIERNSLDIFSLFGYQYTLHTLIEHGWFQYFAQCQLAWQRCFSFSGINADMETISLCLGGFKKLDRVTLVSGCRITYVAVERNLAGSPVLGGFMQASMDFGKKRKSH